jgi:hypothetical protein
MRRAKYLARRWVSPRVFVDQQGQSHVVQPHHGGAPEQNAVVAVSGGTPAYA